MKKVFALVEEKVIISRILPSATLPLRRSVLRPHLSLKDCQHEGDLDPETNHFGAYEKGELIGVASIFKATPPDDYPSDAWRLRGMAVSEKVRQGGIGGMLLAHCIEHVRIQHGITFWCYARIGAIPFYERYGFKMKGEKFDFPHVGPVRLMIKQIEP